MNIGKDRPTGRKAEFLTACLAVIISGFTAGGKAMKEEWKAISGYEGIYEVSNFGRVRGLDRKTRNGAKVCGKILAPQFDSSGKYLMVSLNKDGTKKYINVHRLVAKAFVPNDRGLNQVNHKDEDKTNNRADNLEWCTAAYNLNYGLHNQKAADARSSAVEQLDSSGRIIAKFKSHREAGRVTGIPQGSISHVVAGTRKTAGGYFWRSSKE